MNTASAPLRPWIAGTAGVSLAHIAVIAGMVALGSIDRELPSEVPVVLLELPPLAAPAPSAAPAAQPRPDAPTPTNAEPLPVTAPPVAAPLPREVVAAAPPVRPIVTAPAQAVSLPAARSEPSPAPAQSVSSTTAGDDPRAKAQEANYFAQLSAHLNKRKRYPTEAKKARQQGIVTVRFTVFADGSVTGASIRKSSGHDLLDAATLDLLQRVAPLPRFPKSMTKASVTLSLPIDYSLQTS